MLGAFTKLGLTSFGGPIAHLGYFRSEFVERRRWLSDPAYSDLVALYQLLPGPSSSQVGIALGLNHAGWRGAFAAWLGFTAPSALLLVLFALGVQQWTSPASTGLVHRLKIMTAAVVAQAVWGMARTRCPDWPRAALASSAGLLALAVPSMAGQRCALALGAAAGLWLLPQRASTVAPHAGESPRGWAAADLVRGPAGAVHRIGLLQPLHAVGLDLGVLSRQRAGLRRWPCGAAAAGSRPGATRLDRA